MEFPASTAISCLPLFRNTMKALPLPSPKAMLSLKCKRYYGQLRLPCRPGKISFPYIYRLPSRRASTRASRVHCRMASPACHPCYPGSPSNLSVVAVFVRIDAPVFPFVGEGRQLHCEFRGYIQVRSRCDPQVGTATRNRVCSAPLRSPRQET